MASKAVEFVKRTHWGPADFIMLFAVLVFSVSSILWMSFPSDRFIQQAELNIDGRDVYFKRTTPYGTVTAEWQSEIVVLDGTDFECRSGKNTAVYQSRKSNVARYTLGDWTTPCLAREHNYTITTVRQVILWGFLPMRESMTVDFIEVR